MGKQKEKDIVLRERICIAFAQHPAYGHRRIALELGINKKRVERVMRIFALRPRVTRKKSRFDRTYSGSGVPNLVLGIKPEKPNAIWAGDFTRLSFQKRIAYLSVVMDMYTREVIAWQIAYHHRSALILCTLEDAHRERGTSPAIFHSDQGSEYAGTECVQWLRQRDIQPSHSWKGRPWHNGFVESFFNTFKREFGDPNDCTNIQRLFEAIAQWMHHYNHKRIHGSLHMTPWEYYLMHKHVNQN